MINRDFKGIWIPREVWLDKELTLHEKVLLAEIDSLDNEKGCTASNEYFAVFFDLSERQIQRHILKLKDLGYIKQEEFDGRIRVLKCLVEYGRHDKNVVAETTPKTKKDDTHVAPLIIDSKVESKVESIYTYCVSNAYFQNIKNLRQFLYGIVDNCNGTVDVLSCFKEMNDWLNANPNRRKNNYARFALNWIKRNKEAHGNKILLGKLIGNIGK